MSDNLGNESTWLKNLQEPSKTGLAHKRPGSIQPSSSSVKKSKTEIDKDYREKNKAERIGMKAEIEKLTEDKFRLEGQTDLMRKDLKDRMEEIIRSVVVQERQTNHISELGKKLLALSDAQKKEREDHKKEMDNLKAKHEQEKLELESRIHALLLERGQVMLGRNREMYGNIEGNGMLEPQIQMNGPDGYEQSNNLLEPHVNAKDSCSCNYDSTCPKCLWRSPVNSLICVKCQSQHASGYCLMGTL